jgi:hypothetical protein
MLRDMAELTERTKQRSARLAFLSTAPAGDGHDLTKITSVICPSAANSNSIKAIGLLVSVSKTELRHVD